MAISRISGVQIATISSVYDIPKSNILDVMGISLPYYRVPLISTIDVYLNTVSEYVPIGGVLAGGTTIAQKEILVKENGYIANLRCYVPASASSTNATLTLYKNGSSTGLTLTIGAATVGFFSDDTNNVSVSPGDKLTIAITRGDASSINFVHIGVDYLTKKGVFVTNCSTAANYNVSNTVRYIRPNGTCQVSTTDDVISRCVFPAACTLKSFRIYVSANARATTTNFTLRVNGVDTSIVIAVGAGVTGWVEYTAGTVSIAVGDDVGWKVLGGAEVTTITFNSLMFTVEPIIDGQVSVISAYSTASISTNTTRAGVINSGAMNFAGSVAPTTRYRLVMKGAGSISKLYVETAVNTSDQTTAYRLQKNGTDGSLLITHPVTPTVGEQTDLVNTDSFVASDQVSFVISRAAGGTGSIITGQISYQLTANGESFP